MGGRIITGVSAESGCVKSTTRICPPWTALLNAANSSAVCCIADSSISRVWISYYGRNHFSIHHSIYDPAPELKLSSGISLGGNCEAQLLCPLLFLHSTTDNSEQATATFRPRRL